MSANTLAIKAESSFGAFRLRLDEQLPLQGVTAIFGRSGSGKTTLLRTIAGFETPEAGRIVYGEDLWFDSGNRVNISAHRRPVGFVFQQPRLFDHLNVGGNLAFAEKRSIQGQHSIDRSAVVTAFDLETLLPRRVDSLSGGERQRVALARTLLTSPRLLLLDEPLSALDVGSKIEILPYLEKLPVEFHIPTLYVSHDVEEVAQLADHVVVLEGGQVQTRGPTSQVLERLDLQPITGRFEAGVLVEGQVRHHDQRLRLSHVALGDALLTMPIAERLKPGDSVRLRIRARDVALATRRPEGLSIRNVLPGTLTDLVGEAETGFVEALVELSGARIRARLTQAAVEDLELQKGKPVFALIKSVSFEPNS